MNKILEHAISVLLAFMLVGCGTVSPSFADAQIMELGVTTTKIGLQSVLNGASSTYIITDGRLVFALWPLDSFWGGACINCSVGDPIGQFNYLSGGRGFAMTAKGANEIVTFLTQEHGWKALPAATLKTPQYAHFLSAMGRTLTGFLVLPAGVLVPSLDILERSEG